MEGIVVSYSDPLGNLLALAMAAGHALGLGTLAPCQTESSQPAICTACVCRRNSSVQATGCDFLFAYLNSIGYSLCSLYLFATVGNIGSCFCFKLYYSICTIIHIYTTACSLNLRRLEILLCLVFRSGHNFPNPISNYPNLIYPITISGRKLTNSNLIRVLTLST